MLSMPGAGIFASLQWLIAIVVTMKCTLVDGPQRDTTQQSQPVITRGWETSPKGKWPVVVSVFLLFGIVLVGLVMALADRGRAECWLSTQLAGSGRPDQANHGSRRVEGTPAADQGSGSTLKHVTFCRFASKFLNY